jgi:hypothetical protein
MDAAALSAVLADYRSSSPERAGEAAAQLEVVLDDPSSFFSFLQLAVSSTDPGLRCCCYVFMRLSVRRHKLPDDARPHLLDLLIAESDQQAKRILSDVICEAAQPLSSWPDLITLLWTLLGQDPMPIFGFSLFQYLFVALPAEMIDAAIAPLIHHFVQALSIDDRPVRFAALTFFSKFMGDVDDPLVLADPMVFAALAELFRAADRDLLPLLLNILRELSNDHFIALREHTSVSIAAALDVVQDASVDLETRIAICQLLEDVDDELREVAASAVLNLTVAAIQTDREWDRFSEPVLCSLSSGLWELFATFAVGLVDQGLCFAALFIIGCAIGSNPRAALGSADMLRSLLLESLASDDPGVVAEAAALAGDVSIFQPLVVVPVVNELVAALVQHFPDFLDSLEKVVIAGGRPPNAFEQLVANLWPLVDSGKRANALSCLASLYSFSKAADESIARTILDSGLLEDEDIRIELLDLLRALFKIAPQTIGAVITELLGGVCEWAAPGEWRLDRAIVKFVRAALCHFCDAIRPVAHQILPLLLAICQFPVGLQVESDWDDEYEKFEEDALTALAWFAKLFEAGRAECIELLVGMISDGDFVSAAGVVPELLPAGLLYHREAVGLDVLAVVIDSIGFGDNLADICRRVLAEMDSPSALRCLRALLRRVSLPQFRDALLAIVADEQHSCRGRALECLALLGSDDVVQLVVEALGTDDPELMSSALEAAATLLLAGRELPGRVLEVCEAIVRDEGFSVVFDEAAAVFLGMRPEVEQGVVGALLGRLRMRHVGEAFVLTVRAAVAWLAQAPELVEVVRPVAARACVVREKLWEAMGEEVREAVNEILAACDGEWISRYFRGHQRRMALLAQRVARPE